MHAAITPQYAIPVTGGLNVSSVTSIITSS